MLLWILVITDVDVMTRWQDREEAVLYVVIQAGGDLTVTVGIGRFSDSQERKVMCKFYTGSFCKCLPCLVATDPTSY